MSKGQRTAAQQKAEAEREHFEGPVRLRGVLAAEARHIELLACFVHIRVAFRLQGRRQGGRRFGERLRHRACALSLVTRMIALARSGLPIFIEPLLSSRLLPRHKVENPPRHRRKGAEDGNLRDGGLADNAGECQVHIKLEC